jgi:hypothetical protein
VRREPVEPTAGPALVVGVHAEPGVHERAVPGGQNGRRGAGGRPGRAPRFRQLGICRVYARTPTALTGAVLLAYSAAGSKHDHDDSVKGEEIGPLP